MGYVRHPVRDGLRIGVVLYVALVALPIVAVASLATRAALLVVVVVGLFGGLTLYLVSPRCRRWLAEQMALEITYKGLRLPTDVALHPSHCWARLTPGNAIVGADDLAQTVLGPVEAVELPPVGCRVRRGEPLVRLRRGERCVELRAPASGTVVGRNEDLREHPELVNEQPFDRGWAVWLRTRDLRADRQRLFRGSKARAWFRTEVDRLIGVVLADEASWPGLADGGKLVDDLYRQIDDDAWRRLAAALSADEAPGAAIAS